MGILKTVYPNGKVWIGRPIGVKRPNYTKRLFFLQGHPGNGKSTAVFSVLEKLRKSHPTLRVQGFFNRELRLENKYGTAVGLEVVSVHGQSRVLCSTQPIPDCLTNPPEYLDRYKVDVYGFESIAFPELKLKPDTELFVVDEVGPFELLSTAFYPLLEPIINSQIPVLGVLPHPNFSFNINEVEAIRKRKDTQLYNLYTRNRKQIATKVYARLNQFFLYRKEDGNDQRKRDHGEIQYWSPKGQVHK